MARQSIKIATCVNTRALEAGDVVHSTTVPDVIGVVFTNDCNNTRQIAWSNGGTTGTASHSVHRLRGTIEVE